MSTQDYSELRRTYKEIQIGETASRSRTITESDVFTFAELIDDSNPVHLDAEYAKTTMFGERIAHGMHSASFFTTLIATRLPGIEGIYVSQDLKFIRPVRIGDTITAHAEVVEKNDSKRRITLKTTVKNQRDELVIDGKAVIAVMR
ncbi:MAG TPA: MaoC family dehydratase [Syntrophales bacterium]|nr:MaoC family dehydratase [Syntrophales bacterium]